MEVADPDTPFLTAFVPVEFDGEPTCHEHAAFVWGTPARVAALSLPLAPSDRRYVEHLLSREGTFER